MKHLASSCWSRRVLQLVTLSLLAGSASFGQTTATLFGALANFDVLNDNGQDAYGFEIEIQGNVTIGGTFSANRYGSPQIVPFSGGVYVRYMASWDSVNQRFVTS